MQPVPDTSDSIYVPRPRARVVPPPDTISVGPVDATVHPSSCDRASAAPLWSTDPAESTPRTAPPMPERNPISPALPLTAHVPGDLGTHSESSFLTIAVRMVLAPAPAGSITRGLPRSAAADAAEYIASPVWPESRVPMLTTTASAAATSSAASEGDMLMQGDPPAQMHALAHWFTVTTLVTCTTSGLLTLTASIISALSMPPVRGDR